MLLLPEDITGKVGVERVKAGRVGHRVVHQFFFLLCKWTVNVQRGLNTQWINPSITHCAMWQTWTVVVNSVPLRRSSCTFHRRVAFAVSAAHVWNNLPSPSNDGSRHCSSATRLISDLGLHNTVVSFTFFLLLMALEVFLTPQHYNNICL